jgi:hypothetical protein
MKPGASPRAELVVIVLRGLMKPGKSSFVVSASCAASWTRRTVGCWTSPVFCPLGTSIWFPPTAIGSFDVTRD